MAAFFTLGLQGLTTLETFFYVSIFSFTYAIYSEAYILLFPISSIAQILYNINLLFNGGCAFKARHRMHTLYIYSTLSQSKRPFPSLSSSMPNPITLRLSALKGSMYWRLRICSVAASLPPLLRNFSSMT